MPRLNEVRLVGYLLDDPKILTKAGSGRDIITLKMRTTHRSRDGYKGGNFDDILLFYDDVPLMNMLKSLKKLDLIDVEGVLNILTLTESSICPQCGTKNVKRNTPLICVRPKALLKLNGLQTTYNDDRNLPEKILTKYHKETSNKLLLSGRVVTDPEFIGNRYNPVCRYCLGVEREYYIKTQSQLTADYPWVYTYGQDAIEDSIHLRQGALIVVKGFLHSQKVETQMECRECGSLYAYPNQRVLVIPYKVDYYAGHASNYDLAREEDLRQRMELFKKEKEKHLLDDKQ